MVDSLFYLSLKKIIVFTTILYYFLSFSYNKYSRTAKAERLSDVFVSNVCKLITSLKAISCELPQPRFKTEFSSTV